MDALNALYKLIMIAATVYANLVGLVNTNVSPTKPNTTWMRFKLTTFSLNNPASMGLTGPAFMTSCTRDVAAGGYICYTDWVPAGNYTITSFAVAPFYQVTSEEYTWSQPCVFLPELHRGPYTGPSVYGLPFGEEIETPIPPN